MPKVQLQEQIEFLLSKAIAKCDTLEDAQDLTQETLLSAFLYLEKGGTIENPRAWLTTVMNRKYYDLLRKKYRLPTVTIGEDFDIPDESDFAHSMIVEEEAEQVRREIAYLAESYRTVIAQHYFYNKSVKEIAAELGLPEGTVKSRLDFGRKQIKKGFDTMEKYTENSYMPQRLSVGNSGRCSMNEEPMSLTEGDALAQNLLILAYEKPLTVSELSKAIGVATAYVEPVIKKLVDGELMKQTGDGKVYTDFIIYAPDDHVKYIHEQEAFVEKHIDAYLAPLKTAIEELKATSFYSQRLERFMMIQIASSGLYESMESVREIPQIFPDRPNGGKWIAIATLYPNNWEMPKDKLPKENYRLAGRRCTVIDNYLETKNLKLYNYETSLDPYSYDKLSGYDFKMFADLENNMLKLFYLIKHNIAPETVDLDTRMIKGLHLLEQRGFISTKDGTPKLLIPALSHAKEKEFFDICKKAQKAFGDNIREPLAEYCKTHKKEIPSHLTSVPDQKRTLPYEPDTMMFVFEAINRGIHPRDLGPCPETIAVFD